MSVNRKRARRRPSTPGAAATPSTTGPAPTQPTLGDQVRELIALWPRLEAGLARDGAGPSAAPSGSGGAGGNGSPAVADLDTVSIIARIERGVRELEGEALALLSLPSPKETAAALAASGERITARRRHHAAMLDGLQSHVRAQRDLVDAGDVAPDDLNDLLDRARPRGQQLLAALAAGDAAIARHSDRTIDINARATVVGTLAQLPVWHELLAAREQPLAQHIADDVHRWRRQARAALGLSTRDVALGYTCPHHRDQPAELILDRDEAHLSDDLLEHGRGALVWRYAQSVHCPHCKKSWTGLADLRALMREIDAAETVHVRYE